MTVLFVFGVSRFNRHCLCHPMMILVLHSVHRQPSHFLRRKHLFFLDLELMHRKLRYSPSSSVQYLAFLSALQAVRLLRLRPLSQLELWVCTNCNIELAIPYRSLPAIHPLPAKRGRGIPQNQLSL
jgi:hypothetical protein